MGGDIWGAITIIGPILLVVAIVWAMVNNKRSARGEAHTEAATRQLYDEQDSTDKATSPVLNKDRSDGTGTGAGR